MRDEAAKYRKTDLAQRLALAAMSGATAAAFSNPVEVCLVRSANDKSLPLDQQRGYRHIGDAMSRIVREEGPMALTRGIAPTAQRAALVGATQVGSFDQFKSMLSDAGVQNPFARVAGASLASGLIMACVTMPLETAKNRMAFQMDCTMGGTLKHCGEGGNYIGCSRECGPCNWQYRGTLQTMATVAGSEGPRGLYRGFVPYYARCGVHTVGMFMAVELVKGWGKTVGLW